MNARPLRPVPLVSRPRPADPQVKPPAWWSRRWALAGSVAAFSLVGLLALGTFRTRLLSGGPVAAASPPPSSLVVIPVPTATRPPQPTATSTATPTEVPTSMPSPTSTPALLDESISRSLVERYYAAINSRDFQAAYGLLGAQWRQRQSYDDFASGYRGTVRDTATVTGTASATKDTLHGYVVALDLDAQLAGRLQHYKGLYFVALEDGQPRIQNGELSPQ